MRTPISSLLLVCVFMFTSIAWASSPSAGDWPTASWPQKPFWQAGFKNREFYEFVDYAFRGRLTFSTDSLVIIKDGYLVFEKHANGYTGGQKHGLWSIGKTMMNAIFGVLEKQGYLQRSEMVRKYYPNIDIDGRKDISLDQILRMSSGLEWIEEDKDDLINSDAWFGMYSLKALANMPLFAAHKPLRHAPGTKFNYSSGDAVIWTAIMRGAVGESAYATYAWDQLFNKTGMTSVAVEKDQSQNLLFHGSAYASPYDIARLGLLYLHRGVVNGEPLWPVDWYDYTASLSPSQLNPPDRDDRNLQNNQAYGVQIWLNKKRPEDKTRPYTDLPENALFGMGTRGQILLILPDENLIMVRTATDSELLLNIRRDYRHHLFALLYKSLKGPKK